MTILLAYLFTFLCSVSILVTWNNTLFPVHLTNVINRILKTETDEMFTRDEWETFVILKFGVFGELLICRTCQSWHLAWIISLSLVLFTSIPFLLVPVCFFTLPGLIYLVLER